MSALVNLKRCQLAEFLKIVTADLTFPNISVKRVPTLCSHNTKSNQRNKLKATTIRSIILTKVVLGVISFEPTDMLRKCRNDC